MVQVCALVLAGLCLQQPYDKATDLNAFYAFSDGKTGIAQADVVRQLGARIEVYQSDNIIEQRTEGLARACAGKACVLYLKTCSPDGLECEFDWGSDPATSQTQYHSFGTRSFWIKAASRDAMSRAQRALKVEWCSGVGPFAYIPVTAMNRSSGLAYLPPCVGDRQTDCVNLFLGRDPQTPRTAAN